MALGNVVRDWHERLERGEFGFLDLGCGDGGSLRYCEREFARGPGLGIDIDEGKVQRARENGLSVLKADVRSVEIPSRAVAFCSMMDFLEHLPPSATESVLAGTARVARDFLFIRHPSFEDVDYMRGLGVKFDWTDWSGHRNPLTLAQLRSALAHVGLSRLVIIPRKQVLDTGHEAVVPLSAPTDTVRYAATLHGPKPYVAFDKPVWQQFDIVVRMDGAMSDEEWQELIQIPLRLARQV